MTRIMRPQSVTTGTERVSRQDRPGANSAWWGLAILLLAVLVSAGGCGDKKSEAKKGPSRPAPAPADPNDPAGANADQPGNDTPGSPSDPGANPDPSAVADPNAADPNAPPGANGQDPNAPPPGRSEDLSKWDRDDYYEAREERDDKLVNAVGHLGKAFAGDPQKAPAAAHLLGNLLKTPPEPEEPDEQTPGSPAQPQGSDPRLTEAIVAALYTNGSDAAIQILEEVVLAGRPVELDAVAAKAALAALAKRPGDRTDALLLRALTEAEKVRPAGSENDPSRMTAEQLRTEVMALVKTRASGALRTKLAEYCLNPAAPAEVKTELEQLFQENQPSNLGAQLLLYRDAGTDEETKKKLEDYFTSYSSQAMARLLGVSAEPVDVGGQLGPRAAPAAIASPATAGGSESEADPNLPYWMAGQFWTPEFATLIEQQLAGVKTLAEQSKLLVLAGTLPTESTRLAVAEVLRKHWEDGPSDLESAGLISSIVTDPGLLAAVKALPRRMPKESTAVGGRDVSVAGRSTTAQEKAEKRLRAQEAWMQTSEKLVRAWCARFRTEAAETTAATAPTAAAVTTTAAAETPAAPSGPADAAQPAQGEPGMKLPIDLHPDAQVAVYREVDWPSDLPPSLGGAQPGATSVRYVRIEETARLDLRAAYYRRQLNLKPAELRSVEDGLWLERYRDVPRTDHVLSVDVLITRANPPAATGTQPEEEAKTDEPEDLVIEILSIELRNPTPKEE